MEQGKTQEIDISDLSNFTEYYFEVNVTDEVANITDVATIKTYCKGISCPGEKAVTVSCTKCNGSGKETVSTQCTTCWGNGYTYANCWKCGGSGQVNSICKGKSYIYTTWTEPCYMSTCNGSGTYGRLKCDTCGRGMR